MVAIYNPFVDAYCEVPLSLAEKFLAEAGEIGKRVEAAKVDVAKEEAYQKSLKVK